jgi:hypothetical protein
MTELAMCGGALRGHKPSVYMPSRSFSPIYVISPASLHLFKFSCISWAAGPGPLAVCKLAVLDQEFRMSLPSRQGLGASILRGKQTTGAPMTDSGPVLACTDNPAAFLVRLHGLHHTSQWFLELAWNPRTTYSERAPIDASLKWRMD